MLLDGEPVAPRSPREAMAAGIDLVWGDRTAGSIVPMLSVRENFYINPRAAGLSRVRYIAPARETAAARELGVRVGLRPNDPTMPIEALSGGNQQKVVVGRWLHLRGKVYIFEDPTAGVDVGAKAEIYRLFNVALQAGAAILIVSTDFEEVANVCHRALVFDRGRMVAELAARGPVGQRAARRRFRRLRPRTLRRVTHAVAAIQRARTHTIGTGTAAAGRAAAPAAAGVRAADPHGRADRAVLDPAAGHVSRPRSTPARS